MASVLLKQKEGANERILLLDKDKVSKAIQKIGWKFDAKGVIYTGQGNILVCKACGDVLRLDNLGSFFPGSIEPVCSKFECFLTEMVRVDSKIRARKD